MPLDNSNSNSNAEQYANHIPEAIRRQSARVEELAREAGMAGVTAPEPTDPPATEPVDPPAAEPTQVQPPAPADNFEQKYRTLQGKYDSEVASLRAQVSGMERVMAALQSAPPPAPAARETTTVVVPAEDVETFGEDLVAAARRWARAEMAGDLAEVRELKAQLNKLNETTNTTVVQTGRQSAMAALDADPTLGARDAQGAPRWRVVNDDQQFITWLQQPDPFSGAVRMSLLREAFDAGNAPRVKAFFNAYIAEQTVIQVPATQPSHTPEQGTGRPSLEDLVVPGRGTGQPPVGAPTEKRIWASRDIAAFYRDVQKGAYQGKEADRLRTEQDIISAAAEGRVRQ